MVAKLENMTFDEVSLVRRPANQHASIVFSKADEGDDMPGTLFTEDGVEVDIDDLEIGTEIELEDGQIYTVVADDDEGDDGEYYVEDEYEDDGSYMYVDEDGEADYGKSADYAVSTIAKAFESAVTDDERAQMFADIAYSAEVAKAEAQMANDLITKAEVDQYVNVCISKADEYGFAGDRTEMFGVAIAKMMTVLDEEEIQLMDDIFKSFSMLIDDVAIGTEAGPESEIMDIVASAAGEIIEKSDYGVTPEQAMAAAFDANPDLYALYLDEKGI